MAREAKFWLQLRKAFNPGEVLAEQRGKDFYCDREHSPFDDICDDFDKALELLRPPIAFFTGHRGSGKSSLLLRVFEHFKDDVFVIYFDIEHNLDSTKANQIDLLYLLGAAVFKAAEREGLAPDPKNLQELAISVYTLTHETKEKARDAALNVAELAKGLFVFSAKLLGAGLVETMAEALLKPFTLSSGVSEETARKREIEPQVQTIINNINLIIADVETGARKPLMILVDGLDKLRRPEQAQLIFLDNSALRGPLCRVMYTVPMLIYNSTQFNQVEEECKSYLLPNVKLYDRNADQKGHDPGYRTMNEVVEKRLASLKLKPGDVFAPGVLDELIRKSGGVLRWFIGLVQDSCKFAQRRKLDQVDMDCAQQAIDQRVADLSSRLTTRRSRSYGKSGKASEHQAQKRAVNCSTAC